MIGPAGTFAAPRDRYGFYAGVRDRLVANRGVSLQTWARDNGVTHAEARRALHAPVGQLTAEQRALRARLVRAAR